MKKMILAGMLCLGALASGQDVRVNYDRAANFNEYKTYQWVELNAGRAANPLVEQDIRRAVDEQFALKGMRRVQSGGDLKVAYQVAVGHERQFEGFGSGIRFTGGVGTVTSSTIDIGKLSIGVVDTNTEKLVWTGEAVKTLDIKKDPEKNYKNLQKATAKLFKSYPPGSGQK